MASDISSSPEAFRLPLPKVAVPIEGEEHLLVMKRDWSRLREQVARLKSRRREFAAIAWVAVGVAASALLSLLTWVPAHRGLPTAQRVDFAWVTPSIAACAILGVIVALVCFWAAHLLKDELEKRVEDVLKDMDEMVLSERGAKRVAAGAPD